MLKRTLSLLLALIMVVGLLPNTLVFAADANDDIYIDQSSSLEYLEESEDLDFDPFDDAQPDLPEEEWSYPEETPQDIPTDEIGNVSEGNPDRFEGSPIAPSPVEDLENQEEYPEGTGEIIVDSDYIPELPLDNPELSDEPEISVEASDEADHFPTGSESDFQPGDVAGGSGSLGGMVSGEVPLANAVTINQDMEWLADRNTGSGLDATQGTYFSGSGKVYVITIKPDTAAATAAVAAGEKQLHINLYQLRVQSGASVRVCLDSAAFSAYPGITEVVLHATHNSGSFMAVLNASLTLEGLPGCKLVLDGKLPSGALLSGYNLINIGQGQGAGHVAVSHVIFRNVSTSAVRIRGGLCKSVSFSHCSFEDTVTNMSNGSNDGAAIQVWPFQDRTINEVETRVQTVVQSFTVSNCTFDGNIAYRQGGAISLYGVFDWVQISDSDFEDCKILRTDDFYGGAISMSGFLNEVQLLGNSFENCTAPSSGGAIGAWIAGGKLTIGRSANRMSTFTNCSATTGGAVYLTTKSLPQEHFGFLQSNSYARLNALEISGCSFTGCESTERGGAIDLSTQIGEVTIGKEGTANANTFTNCKTGNGASGGGICFSRSELAASFSWTPQEWAVAIPVITISAVGTSYDDKYTHSNGVNYTSYKSVKVENTTFNGCESSFGGGFYVPNHTKIGAMEIKDVIAKNCKASSYINSSNAIGGGRGAGIALASFAPGCSIKLDNVQVYDNRSDVEGGGVFIDCVANTSITFTGGAYYNNTGSAGGGIYIDSNNTENTTVAFTDTKVYNNTAGGNGGGVYLNIGYGSTTFTDVEIYGNDAGVLKDEKGNIIAKGTADYQGDGGGVYASGKSTATVIFIRGVIGAKKVTTNNDQGEAVVTLQASPNRAFAQTIEKVTPSASPDQPDKITFETGGGGKGGGISVIGSLTSNNSRNNAPKLEMTDTQVLYNQSEFRGGGIYCRKASDATLTNVTVSYNKCAELINGVLTYEFREAVGLTGGGIGVDDNTTLTINGGVISHNVARAGGGLSAGNSSTITMQNTQVTFNDAHQDGGGVSIINTGSNILNAIGCTFADNQAGLGEAGGTGGGIDASTGSIVNLTDVKLQRNNALVGYMFSYNADGTKNYTLAVNSNQNPAYKENATDQNGNPIVFYREQNGYGGGIHCFGSTANLYGVDVDGNEAGRRGGGVYGELVSNIYVYNYPVEEGKTASDYLNEISTDEKGNRFIRSVIQHNIARDYAGGVGSVGNVDLGKTANLLLNGTLVDDNEVTRYGGGGVYISSYAVCTITEGTVVQNNTAYRNAGGIYANIEATVNVNGAQVIHNTSNGSGGGLMISAHSTVKITDGLISDNHALGLTSAGYGGGIYATGSQEEGGSTVTIEGGVISNNTAADNGGGIYAGGSDNVNLSKSTNVTINGGTISGNQALGTGTRLASNETGYGGGIHAGNLSTVTVNTGGTITGNSAAAYGGGIAANVQGVVRVNGGLIGNNAAGSGGGIYLGSKSKVYVTDGTIQGNTATAVWKEEQFKVSYGNGGAIMAAAVRSMLRSRLR